MGGTGKPSPAYLAPSMPIYNHPLRAVTYSFSCQIVAAAAAAPAVDVGVVVVSSSVVVASGMVFQLS